MTPAEAIIKKFEVPGADHYILVHPDGEIAVHDIKDPGKAADLIVSCGKTSVALGKAGFQYLVFSRKSGNDLFIFPVGNYYLGVVKKKGFNNVTLAENVIQFIAGLSL